MADIARPPTPDRQRQGEAVLAQTKSQSTTGPRPDSKGAQIYAAACANCHESGRSLPYGGVNLGLSTVISGPDPRNLANIVLAGIRPVAGEPSPIMPGFAASMNNGEIAALLNFLRSRFSKEPAWSDIEKTVEDARRRQTAMLKERDAP
jgi:mono/diheme cytochrome c family protein